jgi:hypothetical protein
VAAATVAGYGRGSPFAPGLGTHFVNVASAGAMFGTGSGPMTDAQIRNPVLMFNGNDPDDQLAGFMYMTMALGGSKEPEGFAGPNDHWHFHTNLCVAFIDGELHVPLGADQDVTAAQCQAQQGRLMPVTGYMLHVWSVPGWENPNGGVFGDLNPEDHLPGRHVLDDPPRPHRHQHHGVPGRGRAQRLSRPTDRDPEGVECCVFAPS